MRWKDWGRAGEIEARRKRGRQRISGVADLALFQSPPRVRFVISSVLIGAVALPRALFSQAWNRPLEERAGRVVNPSSPAANSTTVCGVRPKGIVRGAEGGEHVAEFVGVGTRAFPEDFDQPRPPIDFAKRDGDRFCFGLRPGCFYGSIKQLGIEVDRYFHTHDIQLLRVWSMCGRGVERSGVIWRGGR